ncbi:MAG: AbrB/MazE/SpoVT family DNA-binding domain-containing protein [Bacteroidia bacterium]|nr:AbrB/MazE/SpoVT family DNA-binding domain-containing protein [Bacteroidia bacterium]
MLTETGKISSDGRVSIPINLRKQLNLSSGDELLFEQKGESISIRKLKDLDAEYLRSVQASCANEWASPEDCEAYDGI